MSTDRIECPACANQINVIAQRCPYCTTWVETVVNYDVIPGTTQAWWCALISAFLVSIIVAAIVGALGFGPLPGVILGLICAIVVDWNINKNGLGKKITTRILDR